MGESGPAERAAPQDLATVAQDLQTKVVTKNNEFGGRLCGEFGKDEGRFFLFPTPLVAGENPQRLKYLAVTSDGAAFIELDKETTGSDTLKPFEEILEEIIETQNALGGSDRSEYDSEPSRYKVDSEISGRNKDKSKYDPKLKVLTISRGGANYNIWVDGGSYITNDGSRNRDYPTVKLNTDPDPDEAKTALQLNIERSEREAKGVQEKQVIVNDPNTEKRIGVVKELTGLL